MENFNKMKGITKRMKLHVSEVNGRVMPSSLSWELNGASTSAHRSSSYRTAREIKKKRYADFKYAHNKKNGTTRGKQDTGRPTIRDLCPEDKHRVRVLIEQVALLGSEKEKMEGEMEKERAAFEEHLESLKAQHRKVVKEKKELELELTSSQLQLHSLFTHPQYRLVPVPISSELVTTSHEPERESMLRQELVDNVFQPTVIREPVDSVFQPIVTQEPVDNVFQPMARQESVDNIFQPIVTQEPGNNVFQPIVTQELVDNIFQPIVPGNNVFQPIVTQEPGNNVFQPIVTQEPGNNVFQPIVTQEPGNQSIVTQEPGNNVIVTQEPGNNVFQPIVTQEPGNNVFQPIVTQEPGNNLVQPIAGHRLTPSKHSISFSDNLADDDEGWKKTSPVHTVASTSFDTDYVPIPVSPTDQPTAVTAISDYSISTNSTITKPRLDYKFPSLPISTADNLVTKYLDTAAFHRGRSLNNNPNSSGHSLKLCDFGASSTDSVCGLTNLPQSEKFRDLAISYDSSRDIVLTDSIVSTQKTDEKLECHAAVSGFSSVSGMTQDGMAKDHFSTSHGTGMDYYSVTRTSGGIQSDISYDKETVYMNPVLGRSRKTSNVNHRSIGTQSESSTDTIVDAGNGSNYGKEGTKSWDVSTNTSTRTYKTTSLSSLPVLSQSVSSSCAAKAVQTDDIGDYSLERDFLPNQECQAALISTDFSQLHLTGRKGGCCMPYKVFLLERATQTSDSSLSTTQEEVVETDDTKRELTMCEFRTEGSYSTVKKVSDPFLTLDGTKPGSTEEIPEKELLICAQGEKKESDSINIPRTNIPLKESYSVTSIEDAPTALEVDGSDYRYGELNQMKFKKTQPLSVETSSTSCISEDSDDCLLAIVLNMQKNRRNAALRTQDGALNTQDEALSRRDGALSRQNGGLSRRDDAFGRQVNSDISRFEKSLWNFTGNRSNCYDDEECVASILNSPRQKLSHTWHKNKRKHSKGRTQRIPTITLTSPTRITAVLEDYKEPLQINSNSSKNEDKDVYYSDDTLDTDLIEELFFTDSKF